MFNTFPKPAIRVSLPDVQAPGGAGDPSAQLQPAEAGDSASSAGSPRDPAETSPAGSSPAVASAPDTQLQASPRALPGSLGGSQSSLTIPRGTASLSGGADRVQRVPSILSAVSSLEDDGYSSKRPDDHRQTLMPEVPTLDSAVASKRGSLLLPTQNGSSRRLSHFGIGSARGLDALT